MNLCVLENSNASSQLSSLVLSQSRWALKLIGNVTLSNEELLDFISEYIPSDTINGLIFDTFYNFYVLFVDNAESYCILIGMTARTDSFVINFLPFLDFFTVDNVYPCTTNNELREIFEHFGPVFRVNSYPALPNSTKYSHVLSGKREISFLLPSNKSEIFIPINVFSPPHRLHVKKLCPACVTEGHRVMNCPHIEEIKVNQTQATDEKEEEDIKEDISDEAENNEFEDDDVIIIDDNSCKSSKSNTMGIKPNTKFDELPKSGSASSSKSSQLPVELDELPESSSTSTGSKRDISPNRTLPLMKSESELNIPTSSLTKDCLVTSHSECKRDSEKDIDLPSSSQTESDTSSIRSEENSTSRELRNGKRNKNKLPEEIKNWLYSSNGVLPPKVIEKIICANVWTPAIILSKISKYSTDFQLIIEQLDKLLSECMNGTTYYTMYPKLVLFKKAVKNILRM